MRIPPLLADFIYNRGCELKCEKFLTRPSFDSDSRIFTTEIHICRNWHKKPQPPRPGVAAVSMRGRFGIEVLVDF